MMVDGYYNPQRFDWPSLPFYILLMQHKIVYFLGHHVMGVFRDFFDFEILASMNFSFFKLISRTLFAVLSTLAIFLVYLTGRRLFNITAGLIAAAFLAVDFLHVKLSHFIIPDGIMILMLIISVYWGAGIYQTGKLRYYLLAGIFSGFAAACKYNGGMVVIPLIFAHLFSPGSKNLKQLFLPLIIMGVASMISFAVSCPYSILDFQNFLWDGLLFQYRHFSAGVGHGGLIIEDPWIYYVQELLPATSGIVLLVLFFAAILWGLKVYPRETIILLLFPLVYGIFLSRSKVLADRYIVPIIPFLYLITGCMFAGAHELIRQKFQNNRFMSALILAPVILICIKLAASSWILITGLHDGNDTRIEAKTWIEKNIPDGTTILVPYENFFSPPLNYYGLKYKLEAYQTVGNSDNPIFNRLVRYSGPYPPRNINSPDYREYKLRPWNHVVDIHDVAKSLQKSGIKYVIITSYRYYRYFNTGKYVTGFTRIGYLYKNFYNTLDAHFETIQVFQPEKSMAKLHYRWPVSPIIKIYKIHRPPVQKMIKKQ
jgi:hypothetical protein